MLPSKLVFRRIVWIVLDSVGIGAMPDAAAFGDPPHADTLGNIARLRGLALPNLAALGLGNIKPLAGIPPAVAPEGAFGRCTLASPGKDTTTGHWEMAGIHLDRALPLYPHGFPPEIMQEFERRIGRQFAGQQGRLGHRDHSRNWAPSTCARARPSCTPPPTACSRWRRTKRLSRCGSCIRSARRRAIFCAVRRKWAA